MHVKTIRSSSTLALIQLQAFKEVFFAIKNRNNLTVVEILRKILLTNK